MFTGNEDMEATALREQGWSISAIARHLGRDRETIRNHLNGDADDRRAPAELDPTPSSRSCPTCASDSREDPHVWATALYDEVAALGFALSYQSFTRGLRTATAAPALRGVRRGQGPGHHRDRAPTGRRDPMGLGRTARGPLGRRMPTCWWARSRARASSAASSPSQKTRPT